MLNPLLVFKTEVEKELSNDTNTNFRFFWTKKDIFLYSFTLRLVYFRQQKISINFGACKKGEELQRNEKI
jgi:hypothetical protein